MTDLDTRKFPGACTYAGSCIVGCLVIAFVLLGDAAAWDQRGANYFRIGEYEKSPADHRKAVELTPENVGYQ